MANELDFGTGIALIKGLGGKPTDAQVTSAVDAWLDAHPEATTTVEDGSITKAKLDNNLAGAIDDVGDLKTAIANCENGTGILVEEGYFSSDYKAVNNHFGTYTYKYIAADNTFIMDRDETAGTKKVSISMADSGLTLAQRLVSIADYPVCRLHVETNIPQANNPVITVYLYQSNGTTLNHNYTVALETGSADYVIDIAKKIADNHWANDVYYVIINYTSDSATYDFAPYIHATNYGFYTENQIQNLNLVTKLNTINTRISTVESEMSALDSAVPGLISEVNLVDDTKTFVGYVASDGSISTPGNINQELATDFIPIVPGVKYILQLWVGVGEFYNNYAYYDSSKVFISRTTNSVPTSTSASEVYYRAEITPPDTAAYIRISARTFGKHKYKLERGSVITDWTPGIREILNPPAWNGTFEQSIYGVIHRGCGEDQVAPECTIPGYIWGKKAGFDFAETDVRYTSDGVAVLLHDASINRTARNADGTTISSAVNIADITYEQALEYDFGIYKGSDYAGTKIPTLEELIVLAKNIGLHIVIEIKALQNQAENIADLVQMIRGYGMLNHVSWLAGNYGDLFAVRDADPFAHLCLLSSDNTAERDIMVCKMLKTTANEVSITLITSAVTSERIAAIKAAGLTCNVYCPNTEEAMLAVDEFVTFVTSDKLNYATVRKAYILGE